MNIKMTSAILFVGCSRLYAGSCIPSQCIPGQGCSSRPTTHVCSNANVCISNAIHNIVTYSNCTLTSCYGGCTPVGCSLVNGPESCGACNQIQDNPTMVSCGNAPPPPPSCGDGICGNTPGEDCATCPVDCGACAGICGDGICGNSAGENCTTCPADCGPCAAPPPPPVGPCGALSFCGDIKDAETHTVSLHGIPVEIRNGKGSLLAIVKTDTVGHFVYTAPLTPGSTYFISPVADRTTSPQPLFEKMIFGYGNPANFRILFVQGSVTVTGTPGNFVLLTNNAYVGNAPPAIPGPTAAWSGTIDMDGKVTIKLPGNASYYVTCWTNTGSGYARLRSKPISDSPLLPQQDLGAVSCN